MAIRKRMRTGTRTRTRTMIRIIVTIVFSCLVLSCLVLSCHALPCLAPRVGVLHACFCFQQLQSYSWGWVADVVIGGRASLCVFSFPGPPVPVFCFCFPRWRCSRKSKTARVSPAFHIVVAFVVAVAVAAAAVVAVAGVASMCARRPRMTFLLRVSMGTTTSWTWDVVESNTKRKQKHKPQDQ